VTDYLMIPTHIVNRERQARERAALRRARYDTRHHRKTNHHKVKPFCMWDGEGPQDAGYALFGNSLGMEICHPFLKAKECLDLMLRAETEHPGYTHIAFGFNYDVSMILGDLPFRHLSALHEFGKTVWEGYELEHIPHKWFTVRYGKVRIKIYDIRSFFAGNYISALKSFGVGTPEEISAISSGKGNRATFQWAEISDIREYFRTELKLGPQLAEKLRTAFSDAGYNLQSWHGPGALARMALKRHKVYDAMAESPKKVAEASRHAFAGGRFEMMQAGHANHEIWNADIHSAYPAFATQLPNLARGKWRKGKKYEEGKFAVYRIRYESHPDPWKVYPLFRRLDDGTVVWPCRVEGWYWAPEAALVADDTDATFLESWVFDEDNRTDRPFAWLEEYYRRRNLLKGQGNAAEYTFKLIINSVYGQLAQRAGWDRKSMRPPRSHQLEWAGYITSACRARVYAAGTINAGDLVSVDTDGIYTTRPVPLDNVGNGLGQWEIERYDDGIFWQSGIYMLRKGDTWVKSKTRGIPAGSYTAEDLLAALERGEPLRLKKRVFITYGLAQNQPQRLNQWVDEPHEFVFGGRGKRLHFPKACRAVCKGLHRLGVPHFLFSMGDDIKSRPHYLPWLDNDKRVTHVKTRMADLTLFDADHLADEDSWVRDFENPHETGVDSTPLE
jgi:hypothetical protein